MKGKSRQTGAVLLDVSGRHPLLARGPVVHDDGRAGLTIDMSGLSFASPLDLAAVAAVADRAARQCRRVEVLAPTEPSVASYVERMDLFKQLHERVLVSAAPATTERTDKAHVLVEVSRVASTQRAVELGRTFADLAEQQHDGVPVPGLFRTLGELLDNAATHGRSPGGGFAAAQYYTGETSSRPGFELAVCDNGVGVLEHLRGRYQRLASNETALRKAVLAKVSGTSEDGRGWGLHDVVQDLGRQSRAAFVLASGSAALYTSMRDGLRITRVTQLGTPIEGTWVWLRVRLPNYG